jgi:hypothetical protein
MSVIIPFSIHTLRLKQFLALCAAPLQARTFHSRDNFLSKSFQLPRSNYFVKITDKTDPNFVIAHRALPRVFEILWAVIRVVYVETRYGLDGPETESRWGRSVPHPSSPVLASTQPPIQVVPHLFLGGKAAGA